MEASWAIRRSSMAMCSSREARPESLWPFLLPPREGLPATTIGPYDLRHACAMLLLVDKMEGILLPGGNRACMQAFHLAHISDEQASLSWR